MPTAGKLDEVRDEDLPPELREFRLWFKGYCDKHHMKTQEDWTVHFDVIAAEAARLGIKLHPDGSLEWPKKLN